MSKSALQSDKMRNKSIGKLLLEMSLPAIFSMLVQSLYNIVDSLFVTNMTQTIFGADYVGVNLGKDSFTAVSIVFPMTTFVVAIAIGIGVGANAYIARKLGEGNREKANQTAKTAIVMAFVLLLQPQVYALSKRGSTGSEVKQIQQRRYRLYLFGYPKNLEGPFVRRLLLPYGPPALEVSERWKRN